jgi:hypothetical protein
MFRSNEIDVIRKDFLVAIHADEAAYHLWSNDPYWQKLNNYISDQNKISRRVCILSKGLFF